MGISLPDKSIYRMHSTALPATPASLLILAHTDTVAESHVLKLLSQQEHSRLLGFKNGKDQKHFILAHGLKRYLLSSITKIAAHKIPFQTNAHGKPFCTVPNAPLFNLSHNNHWVAIALSMRANIGVDVECQRNIAHVALSQRICSVMQQQQYRQSTDPNDTMLCYWAQKEAISKAYGSGIGIGLANVPCSGQRGRENIRFMNKKYYLWTSSLPNIDGSVLALASTDATEPTYQQVTHFSADGLILNNLPKNTQTFNCV